MQRTKRKICFIIISFVFINLLSVVTSAHSPVINFGQITASEKIEVEKLLKFNIIDNVEYLEVYLEKGKFIDSGNNILSGSRLEIKSNKNGYLLNGQATKILIDELFKLKNQLFCPLYLKIQPSDMPGTYREFININFYDKYDQILFQDQKEIIFTVNHWVLIRYQYGERVLINRRELKGNGKTLTNQITPIIQIAANGPWKLYGLLDTKGTSYNMEKNNFNIIIPQIAKVHLISKHISLESNETLLLSGDNTVKGDDHWLDIPLKFTIDNFIYLPAGRIKLPVHFIVKY